MGPIRRGCDGGEGYYDGLACPGETTHFLRQRKNEEAERAGSAGIRFDEAPQEECTQHHHQNLASQIEINSVAPSATYRLSGVRTLSREMAAGVDAVS